MHPTKKQTAKTTDYTESNILFKICVLHKRMFYINEDLEGKKTLLQQETMKSLCDHTAVRLTAGKTGFISLPWQHFMNVSRVRVCV